MLLGKLDRLQRKLKGITVHAPAEHWPWASSAAADLLWRLGDSLGWQSPTSGVVPVMRRHEAVGMLGTASIREFSGVEGGKGAMDPPTLAHFADSFRDIGCETRVDWAENLRVVSEDLGSGRYPACYRSWDDHLTFAGRHNHHFAALYKQSAATQSEFDLEMPLNVRVTSLVDSDGAIEGLSELFVVARSGVTDIVFAVESLAGRNSLDWFVNDDLDVALVALKDGQWFAEAVAGCIRGVDSDRVDLLARYRHAIDEQRRNLALRGW